MGERLNTMWGIVIFIEWAVFIGGGKKFWRSKGWWINSMVSKYWAFDETLGLGCLLERLLMCSYILEDTDCNCDCECKQRHCGRRHCWKRVKDWNLRRWQFIYKLNLVDDQLMLVSTQVIVICSLYRGIVHVAFELPRVVSPSECVASITRHTHIGIYEFIHPML